MRRHQIQSAGGRPPCLVAPVPDHSLDSGRPIFFGQRRVGRGGAPFKLMKFRTMAQHAEAARIISGDNEFELMLYLAKLMFESLGFSFDDPSPRGSGWGRTGKKKP